MHQVEHSPPAGLGWKVNNYMDNEFGAFPQRGALVLVFRSFERPISEKWPANNIFLWNEAPIAAIKADLPVISHAKVIAFGNDQVITLNMILHNEGPIESHIRPGQLRIYRRKLITIRIVQMSQQLHIWLIERHAITVNNAIAQMNAVARNADNAFYHMKSLGLRGEKYHDVAVLNFSIRKQRAYIAGLTRGREPVYKDMIADQQGVFHRAGRNLESLHYKRNNEESRNQDRGNAGNGFWQCLFRPGFFLFFALFSE